MELSSQDEVFLTSLFTMLNKIIETDPDFFVVEYVKAYFNNIDTIPTIHEIPTFIKDPSVITAFNKNPINLSEMYGYIEKEYRTIISKETERIRETEITPQDEVFLTEYFTMLNKIIETNPTFYVVGFVKKSFNIETIPTMQEIPTFIKDPRVITAFNKKQIFVREMYGHIEKEYHQIVLNEKQVRDRLERTIIIRPSRTYAPFKTFNFGSVRRQNAFNEHFINSPNSILLLMSIHGKFVENPVVLRLSSGVHLNKYSNAATGQCSYSSIDEEKYVVYTICDAVNNDGIIDVPTIIKEGIAHARTQLSQNHPDAVFERTESSMDRTYNRNITAKFASTAQHSGKVGEEITSGNSFFEKEYNLDVDRLFGIFLCNAWGKIGGEQMDNLLANPEFIHFMNEKYEPANRWIDGDDTPTRRKYYGLYRQLLTKFSPKEPTELYCIKTFVSSDLFDFCKIFGKTEINLIDTSCSAFYGTYIGEVITEDLTKERYALHDIMNSSINEKVAKGHKGKKCKSKKCKSKRGKSKSKRGKGSKKKLKGR